MSIGELAQEFLDAEGTAYVRGLLLDAAASAQGGERYFTFDAFNVRLDFDAQTATVEDELEPDAVEEQPLADFLAAVRV